MFRSRASRVLYGGTCLVLLVLSWWLQARLHDGSYNFSVLSEPRKHMTLHSEQAFYLSFYFDTIRAKSPFHAFFDLVSDDESEHPHTINALNRFNIYPEYLLGLLHRFLTVFVAIDPYTLVMHAIFALAGVQLAALFLLAAYTTHSYLGGILAAAAFVFNLNETTRVYSNPLLRESFSLPFLWMQIALVVRVLRRPKRTTLDAEVGAAPADGKGQAGAGKGKGKGPKALARARMVQRARGKPSRVQQVRAVVEPCLRRYPELVASTFLFMISWQFSQFVLFLQTAALLATHLLGYTPGVVLHDILVCTMTGAVLVALAMFGNTMVLGSLFLVFAGSVLLLQYRGFIALEPAATAAGEEDAAAKTKKRGRRDAVSYDGGVCARFVGAAWRVVLVFACTLAVKLVLGLFATEDAHVFNLLKAKLGDYEDFDTAMYLCGSAYNPLPRWAWDNMMATSVLHRAGLVLAAVLLQMVADFLRGARHADPAIVFLFWQSVAFTLLGVAIMRLMLFFTPSYCVLAALLASPTWYQRLTGTFTCQPAPRAPAARAAKGSARRAPIAARVFAAAVGVVLLALACYLGQPVLRDKLESTKLDAAAGRQPTSAEQDMLELLSWVNKNTRRDAVLVSSLALSSTLRIGTGRKLAIHPHAEDAGMRKRYRSMYTMYSKLSEDAVYASIRPLQGDYLVIPFSSCDGKCSSGRGLDSVAALGVDTARQWAMEYNDKLDSGSQLPQLADDETWTMRHDQFCYLVTQEPLRHFEARFQNNLYLVLAIPK